ncbi:MAG: hypothetical protein Q9226_004351 [Calogaya cf. arnoldii]
MEPEVSKTGDSKLLSLLPQGKPPQLGVLPNPYRVPGTRFEINFLVNPGEISKIEFQGCLSGAYRQTMTKIEQGRGAERIDPRYLRQVYFNVVFAIFGSPILIPTYNDAKSFIEAFWLKSTEDGYHMYVGIISQLGTYPRQVAIARFSRMGQPQTLMARASPKTYWMPYSPAVTLDDSLSNRLPVPMPLRVLPNPYPVPGKPFSMNFIAGEELERIDVRGVLSQAYKQVMRVIESGAGKRTLSPLGILAVYRGVAFYMGFVPLPLTYNDAQSILNAFWLKAAEDGASEWRAHIIYDSGREIGIANLVRKPGSRLLSTREVPSL